MIPYSFFFDWIFFGNCYFSTAGTFLTIFLSSLFAFGIIYFFFGSVAILIKKRFPGDSDLFRRIIILLPIFYLMTVLMVQGIFFAYESFGFSNCQIRRWTEWWATGYGCLCSTIITFVNEAVAGWEKWKASVTETSRAQSNYQKSRLLALKRQINPHFLFNCFNTLSSLIIEDEEEAEKFLDEMTKVYRYLLKGDNEQIVTLAEELQFIQSYLYLNKTRFGNALQVSMDVDNACRNQKMPPLSLQVIVESIIYRNAFSKTQPLFISIIAKDGELSIENNLQPKQVKDVVNYEEELDNLFNKYQLLNPRKVVISETETTSKIILPLLQSEEEAIC
jgi:sensor histidine kinase YesM